MVDKDIHIEPDYINTVSKLKFISKIQMGEKIDTQSLTVSTTNIITKLYRSLFSRGESRNLTFEFLSRVVNDSFNLIQKYIEYKDDIIHKNKINEIIIALESSKDGMLNLIDTYKFDRMYVSKVDTLINAVSVKSAYIKSQI